MAKATGGGDKEREEALEAKEQARKRILKAIEQSGNFTHNIVSLTLADIKKKYDKSYANQLIEEMSLDRLFGIFPE